MVRNGMAYINQKATRFVVLEDGKHERLTFTTKLGKRITRRVVYYKLWGNTTVCCIRYKGKRIEVLLDEVLND